MGMEWLFGTFGSRKFIGCKESQECVPNGGPVSPWRLMIDKQLDYTNLQPRSFTEEQGSILAMNTWGRPMDRVSGLLAPVVTPMSPEMLPTPYYDSQHMDGTALSVPVGVGSVVRATVADTLTQIRQGRSRYSK